jgi:hypothetical protein
MKEAMEKLGLTYRGGCYITAKQLLHELQLDISHMTHDNRKKHHGIKATPKTPIPIEEYLRTDTKVSTTDFKARLLKEGLLQNQCALCSIVDWLGQPLTLHLDHINGDRYDNRLENLRILCPNCHSQTPTFAGRNQYRRRGVIHHQMVLANKPTCPSCGAAKTKKAKYCLDCAKHKNAIDKTNWPSYTECCEFLRADTLQALATKFKVDSSTLRHYMVSITPHGLPVPWKTDNITRCGKCSVCGGRTGAKNISRCHKCYLATVKLVVWPPEEQLVKDILSRGFSAVGRELGVSDKAVYKHLKVKNWKEFQEKYLLL